MNFYEHFVILSDAGSTDISQTNEFLNTMLAENPTQFILNLIEIINTESAPQNIKKNALQSLTIPTKKKNGTPIRQSNIDYSAIIPPLFETLHNLLTLDDDAQRPLNLGEPSVDIYILYTNVLSIEESLEVINSLFSKIADGIPDYYLQRILKITSEIASSQFSQEAVPEYIQALSGFFSSVACSDEAKHYFLLTVSNLISSFDFQTVEPDFSGALFELIWTYASDFPSESALILKHLIMGFPELFSVFPAASSTYIEALQSSLDMWPFLNICVSLFFHESSENLLSEHWNEILVYCISLLESDTSTVPICEDEYHDDDTKIPIAIRTIEMILELHETESIQLMQEYIGEHIGEEGTPAKFVVSVLANKIGKKITDDILFGVTIEHNVEERQQILLELLHDDSPRVMQQAIDEAASLVNDSQLEPDDDLLTYALTVFFSENSVIADLASKLLSAIANSDKEGAREAVVSKMLEIIEQYENVEKVAEALRVLSTIAQKMDPESALGMIEEVIQLAQTLISEHFSDPTVSPCIGFLAQLVRTSGQSCSDHLETLIELSTTLNDNDFEDDGMFMLSALVDIFSGESAELVQGAIDLAVTNIDNPNNIPNLNAVLSLTTSIVGFVEDTEVFDHIISTCIQYLSEPSSTIPLATKSIIVVLLAKINEAAAESISAHANEFLSKNRSVLPMFAISGSLVLKFVLNLANSVEDGCENFNLLTLLLQALRGVVRKTFRIDENRVDVAMQILTLISAKTPKSISQTFMPINVTTYNVLESMLNNEQKEFLHSICPKPVVEASPQ